MVFFSKKTLYIMNKKCELTVLILSWLICFIAIWLCTYGFLEQKGDIYLLWENSDERIEFTGVPGYITLISGNISFITGILGCMNAKYKNIYLTCPFMLLSLSVMILLFISAGFAISDSVQPQFDIACSKPFDNYPSLSEYASSTYGRYVDKYMCS